jgi:hypothetical protein
VILGSVTPWIEIARKPQYVQASLAERRAIGDLYWNICVEQQIPLAQRESAYWQFVRDSEHAESGGTYSAVPSPVDEATMRLWCKRCGSCFHLLIGSTATRKLHSGRRE